MRDLERWKEQVELSLDGRQIFFLFFGSAVAACVIFVAGVLVGKRIEQHAQAATQVAPEDPLAALDRLGAGSEADDGLTFHEALSRGERRGRRAEAMRPKQREEVSRPEPRVDEDVNAEAPEPIAAAKKQDSPSIVKKPEAPAAARKPEAPAVMKKPEIASLAKKQENGQAVKKPEMAQVGKKPMVQAAQKKLEVATVAKKPENMSSAKKPELAQSLKKPEIAAAAHKPGEEHFTLQLSSFPDRGEAEQFVKKMQSAGYHPLLSQTEIPGRGTYFRVRVGEYGSLKAAAAAKGEFERKQHIVAYVAKQ